MFTLGWKRNNSGISAWVPGMPRWWSEFCLYRWGVWGGLSGGSSGGLSVPQEGQGTVGSVTSAQNWSGILPWCPCSLSRGTFVRKREGRESNRGRDRKIEKERRWTAQLSGYGKEDQLWGGVGQVEMGASAGITGVSVGYFRSFSSWEML